MSDIIIDGNDGNFIIESGSNSVPVFKVAGNTITVSGSLIPGEAFSGSAISELGSVDYPWKELYVESASINFVDTSLPSDHSDRKVTFSRVDVEDLKAGRMPGNTAPLSRFQQELTMEGRVAAVNNWYGRGRMRDAYMGTSLATSDPDGTTITSLQAFSARHLTIVNNMLINKVTLTIMNNRNNDNIVFSMFKGTLVNDSTANVTINDFGTPFTPTMTRNKNYLLTQTLTSSNTLSAGDFLMFTIHTTSYAGTCYPMMTITLDGQYR